MEMSAVEAARQAVARWEQQVKALEEKRKAAEAANEEALKTRRDVALSAATGDPEAEKKLKAAVQQAVAAQVEMENTDLALAAAKEALENARKALQEAERLQALAEYRALGEQRRQVAEAFEAKVEELAELAKQCHAVESTQQKAVKAAGLNLSGGQVHWFLATCLAQHLRDLVEARWGTDRYPYGMRLADADPFCKVDGLPGLGGGKPA